MKYEKILKEIKSRYDKGENIMSFFRDLQQTEKNTLEAILISYDLQAGSYIKIVEEKKAYSKNYTQAIAHIIGSLDGATVMEVGVGEATTLCNVIEKLPNTADYQFFGFDLSWSRVRFAKQYAESKNITNLELFTGDLFNIPLQDNSIDIVYTSHSIEPNGGKEKEALQELFRITKNYLILLEPAYELANDEAKARMERHQYVQNLSIHAKELGMKVITHRLFDYSANPLNPTGLIIIEKENKETVATKDLYACPLTKAPLMKINDEFFSPDSLLLYPKAGGIPCLLPNNAIVASHYLNFVEQEKLTTA